MIMAKFLFFIAITLVGYFGVNIAAGAGQLIGGISPGDLKDGDRKEVIANLTLLALDVHNNRSDSNTLQGLVRIKEAKSQIVAGEMFYIKFYVGPTKCEKGKDEVDCPLDTNSLEQFELCEAQIWEKKWQNFREVTKLSCMQSSKKEAEA